MKLSDVTEERLRKVPDSELLSLHRRVHQLYGRWEQEQKDEPFPWTSVHELIVAEMERRGMEHTPMIGLDKADVQVPEWIRDAIEHAPEYVIVPQYVSLVGSAISSENPGDVDIVVRDDLEALPKSWRDSVWVCVRDVLDPEKELGVRPHLISAPHGPMYFPPHHTYIGLFDLVLRPRLHISTYPIAKVDLVPITYFRPPKPAQGGRINTDAFSSDEVWPWVARRLKEGQRVFVEPKYNGYHATFQRRGDDTAVFYEDKPRDRWPALKGADPDLAKLETLPDCILDCDVGIEGPTRWPRSAMAQLNAVEPSIPEGAHIVITVWDVAYWDGEKLADRPFVERRAKLEQIRDRLEEVGIRVAPQMEIRTKDDLVRAWRSTEFGMADKAEGIMLKASDWRYEPGDTNDTIKIKHAVELKVIVLDRTKTKGGAWVLRCGLLPGDMEIANVAEGPDGRTYVDLGETAPTTLEAKPGDIVTVQIEELTYDSAQDRMYYQNAVVVDIDSSRTTPYFAGQAVDMADRALVLHLLKAAGGDDDGETRSDSAMRNWEDRWYQAMPLGEARDLRFVVQAHWRGLSADEAKMDMDSLLRTDNALHFDLRLETNRFKGWWGVTLFAGRPGDNTPKLKLERMLDDPEVRLEGSIKQFGHLDWLDVGRDKPLVLPPGTQPSDRQWSKFFLIEEGTWRLGAANRHMVELWLEGRRGIVRGRYVLQYAPMLEGGARAWLFTRPEDQRPYAETHKLEDVAEYLARRDHKWLFWPTPPPDGPIRMYEIIKPDDYRIVKQDEKRYTLGVAYPARDLDSHGDMMTEDELEKTAWDFLLRCQRGDASIGLWHHPSENYRGRVVESYIWRGPDWQVGDQVVRAGDWLLGVIWDPDAWELIKAGKVRGYSIQGWGHKRESDYDR
ncbi:XkdF-like putative serine protease domain-containing protein [Thermogutta sp.]|uniref:XkdF-like putative serine protease domain-containing protein n=1 Tax=Thermogutta sp. TaxID=1962930 RepID=UPI0032209D1E